MAAEAAVNPPAKPKMTPLSAKVESRLAIFRVWRDSRGHQAEEDAAGYLGKPLARGHSVCQHHDRSSVSCAVSASFVGWTRLSSKCAYCDAEGLCRLDNDTFGGILARLNRLDADTVLQRLPATTAVTNGYQVKPLVSFRYYRRVLQAHGDRPTPKSTLLFSLPEPLTRRNCSLICALLPRTGVRGNGATKVSLPCSRTDPDARQP
jgi:hypothetical protein